MGEVLMSRPLNFREDAARLDAMRRNQRSMDIAARVIALIGVAVIVNVAIGALAAWGGF
jgi:hypothetical protein